MTDLFKSAMGYFNTGPTNASDNEFVGQIVEVGSVKLRVKRVHAIAKGLCMFVFFSLFSQWLSEKLSHSAY